MCHYYKSIKCAAMLFLFFSIIFLQSVNAQVATEDGVFTKIDTTKIILSQKQKSRLQNVRKRKTTADVNVVDVKDLDVLLHNESLHFNLFPEYSFNFKCDKVKQYAPDNFVWYGTCSNNCSAILTVIGNDITGTVTADKEMFKIEPLSSGLHVIIHIDPNNFPPEHPPEYKTGAIRQGSSNNSKLDKSMQSASDFIDVLVAYTPSASSAHGNINGLIQTAISESNQSYENSDISLELYLVHSVQVSYTESGSFYTDLDRSEGTSDGYMDNIHDLRDQYAADVCVLIINNDDYCGLASTIKADESNAFCVVHYDCATGYYSFGHEIGHLQGARHNLYDDGSLTPYAYGHGYRYRPDAWRTIMAYDTAGAFYYTRIQNWSNPDIDYNYVAMGTATYEDNARVLDNTESDVTGFRSYTSSGTLSHDEIWSHDHTITNNLTVPTDITLIIEEGVTVTIASGKKIAVNGTLNADNVTFEAQSGTWYGIEFTNASSSSQIWYCTIEDATVGVHMNNTDIYLLGNDINNNTTGLLFNSGSDGVANSNEITFNDSCGIKCTSYSDPLLFTCNIICDNGYGYGGVYGDASSIFDLGRYSDQGHNSIYYNDPYEVTTYYSGTIYAKYNWWGDSDPDPNLSHPNGNIDWSNYLTSDPNTMLAKAISKNPGSDAPIMKATAASDSIGISEVDYAYLIYRKEAYQAAASLFETIVHKYPAYFSGRRALAFLYKCNKHLNKASENLTLLDNVSATYATEEIDALAKNIAAGELIKQGDYQAAIAKSEAVTNSFAETAYSKQAKFIIASSSPLIPKMILLSLP